MLFNFFLILVQIKWDIVADNKIRLYCNTSIQQNMLTSEGRWIKFICIKQNWQFGKLSVLNKFLICNVQPTPTHVYDLQCTTTEKIYKSRTNA